MSSDNGVGAVAELQGAVNAALSTWQETRAALTEDAPSTLGLCVALEGVLQCGLRQAFFGGRRDYYAYLLECLGPQHDVIAAANASLQVRGRLQLAGFTNDI